jgi:hypothetical protein
MWGYICGYDVVAMPSNPNTLSYPHDCAPSECRWPTTDNPGSCLRCAVTIQAWHVAPGGGRIAADVGGSVLRKSCPARPTRAVGLPA